MSQSIPSGYIPPGQPRGLAHKDCRELDKKIARVVGIRSLKKTFPGVARGMYPVRID